MKRVLGLSLLLFICSAQTRLHAEVKLAGVFSDHMVLQQDQKVPIWGTAEAGAPVTALLMAKMPYAVKRRTAAVNQRSKCRHIEVLRIFDFGF